MPYEVFIVGAGTYNGSVMVGVEAPIARPEFLVSHTLR